jgi:signal transduction histidine kinase
LYRIAQEAVTNVVKHAEARTISIQIGSESGVVTLRIADDGVGIRNAARKRDGMGLRIMQYRATSIGAHLTVEPRPTGGTVVTCTLREMPPPATSHTSGPGSGSVR